MTIDRARYLRTLLYDPAFADQASSVQFLERPPPEEDLSEHADTVRALARGDYWRLPPIEDEVDIDDLPEPPEVTARAQPEVEAKPATETVAKPQKAPAYDALLEPYNPEEHGVPLFASLRRTKEGGQYIYIVGEKRGPNFPISIRLKSQTDGNGYPITPGKQYKNFIFDNGLFLLPDENNCAINLIGGLSFSGRDYLGRGGPAMLRVEDKKSHNFVMSLEHTTPEQFMNELHRGERLACVHQAANGNIKVYDQMRDGCVLMVYQEMIYDKAAERYRFPYVAVTDKNPGGHFVYLPTCENGEQVPLDDFLKEHNLTQVTGIVKRYAALDVVAYHRLPNGGPTVLSYNRHVMAEVAETPSQIASIIHGAWYKRLGAGAAHLYRKGKALFDRRKEQIQVEIERRIRVYDRRQQTDNLIEEERRQTTNPFATTLNYY